MDWVCLEQVRTPEIFVPEPFHIAIHGEVYIAYSHLKWVQKHLFQSNDSHRNTYRGIHGPDMLRMGLGS